MATSNSSTYFTVEVCDDHDGGSVWMPEEDYMEQDDAERLAKKLSETRDNKVSRVMKVEAAVFSCFAEGEEVECEG